MLRGSSSGPSGRVLESHLGFRTTSRPKWTGQVGRPQGAAAGTRPDFEPLNLQARVREEKQSTPTLRAERALPLRARHRRSRDETPST